MDWAAKMFGLHGVFWNVNEVGGGVIQVGGSYFVFPPRADNLNLWPRLLPLTQLLLLSLLLEPDTSMNTRVQRWSRSSFM